VIAQLQKFAGNEDIAFIEVLKMHDYMPFLQHALANPV
jgi:hypothetical protein